MTESLSQRLERRVRHLAETIGERHYRRPEALVEAYRFIRGELDAFGVEVEEHVFRVDGMKFINLVTKSRQRAGSASDETLVIGAHYDTVPGTPGADDNATAVAALLELVQALGASRFARSIHFAFFPNEEPPFFPNSGMGSDAYARELKAAGQNVSLMISLEMLGYYSDEAGSQRHVPGLGWLYPNRGDFIAFVSNVKSRPQMHRAKRAFKASTAFPCESLAAPELTTVVGLSDHRSFWAQNYPGLMITDTAFMRNPHYHQATDTPDTPDTLDFARFAQVTEGIIGMVRRLADET